MATVQARVDTEVNVYHTVVLPPLLGFHSKFSAYNSQPHSVTGKLINGWQWNNTYWASAAEQNTSQAAPSIFDASTSGLISTDYQAGIGDNLDLTLKEIIKQPASSGVVDKWLPKVRHGYMYFGDDERWLYNDDSEREFVTTANHDVTNSGNVIPFPQAQATGVPISVTIWTIDASSGNYLPLQQFRKVDSFTGTRVSGVAKDTLDRNDDTIWANIDRSEPEFITTTTSSGTINVLLNADYRYAIGDVTVTGVDMLTSLEPLGIHDGSVNRIFTTLYSPIVTDETIEIWTDEGDTGTQYSGVNTFTTAVDDQVIVDTDLGVVEFGSTLAGGIPAAGSRVYAKYTRGVEAEYEPEDSSPYTLAEDACLNPILRSDSTGFVVVRKGPQFPASLILTSELDNITEDIYGPLFAGNNTTPVVATVLDFEDLPIEGMTIEFELTDTQVVGSFTAGQTTIDAISNGIGQATTFYNAPGSIDEMGETSSGLVVTSGISELTFNNIPITEDLTRADANIFLYKVFADDPLLGVFSTTANLGEYYTNFFVEQGISQGYGTGTTEWESFHRLIHSLVLPLEYDEISRNGRKALVITTAEDSNAINPHTGEVGAFVPFQPIEVSTVSGQTLVSFSGVLDSIDIENSPNLAGYFLVAPAVTTIRARVFNERLAQYIYSNEIQIKSDIPPTMNGYHVTDDINTIADILPSSGAIGVLASGDFARVPFGFRLQGDGSTLASALDGVTFLGVNSVTGSGIVISSGVPPTQTIVPVPIGETMNNATYLVDLAFSWAPSGGAMSSAIETTSMIGGRTTDYFEVTVSGVPTNGGTMSWAVTPTP